tara:strand:+ start:213 stop:383 length:171 start_codon:yes stop_codon:yes gene_type:complete
MKEISKSSVGTLKSMLKERWEKVAWYNYLEKDNLINIAKSYDFDDLVEHFNETYAE